VTDHSVVCEKHFVDSFITRTTSATRFDGSILTVPLKCAKLATDANQTPNPNRLTTRRTCLPNPPDKRQNFVLVVERWPPYSKNLVKMAFYLG
jgi:hypothetical protein